MPDSGRSKLVMNTSCPGHILFPSILQTSCQRDGINHTLCGTVPGSWKETVRITDCRGRYRKGVLRSVGMRASRAQSLLDQVVLPVIALSRFVNLYVMKATGLKLWWETGRPVTKSI